MSNTTNVVNCVDVDSITTVISNMVSTLSKSPPRGEWVLIGITLAYVIVTGLICYFNHRSVKASEKLIEETKNIQRQNVNIQLLQKRHEVYLSLKNWYTELNTAVSEDINDTYANVRAIRTSVLKYTENEKLLSYNSQIMEYKNLLRTSYGTTKEREHIENKLRVIYIEYYNYIVMSAKKKQDEINMGAYLFSLDAIDVDNSNKITNTYIDIVEKVINMETMESTVPIILLDTISMKLEGETKNMLDGVAKILETMEKQLNELRKSFSE